MLLACILKILVNIHLQLEITGDIFTNGYRNPDINKAEIFLDLKVKTDDNIKVCEIIANDILRKVIDEKIMYKENLAENIYELENYKIELFDGELGNINFLIKAVEGHEYMPSKEHVFYKELLEKIKEKIFEMRNIQIKNMQPNIYYNLNNKKYEVIYIN